MTVVRGGRVSTTLAEQRADEAEARRAHDLLLADVRELAQRPAFLRLWKHLLAQSGAFARPRLFTAEANWISGRAEFGMQLWNLLVEADPSKVLALLDITTGQPVKDTE